MMRFAYLLFALFAQVLKGALEQEAATPCDGTGANFNSGGGAVPFNKVLAQCSRPAGP